ncbi:MAG: DUF1365 domain-containing protein [Pseudomonadota bacterium]
MAQALSEALPDQTIDCLYQGHVMHMRLTPFVHKFRYRVFSLLLDIDRIEETLGRLRLLSLDRLGLMSFHRRDHGYRDGSDLRPWVEAELAAEGIEPPSRIWLLSFPRLLGYAFNPLAIYFCEDAGGRISAIVYQVKNTFGDQHAYVLQAEADADGAFRHEHDKGFFVSPFIEMDQTYRFQLRRPDERLSVQIRQHDANGPYLVATQNGDRRTLSDPVLLKLWLTHPLMTFKVIAAIHWQALKLWLKGARFIPYRGPYPDPDAPETGLRARVAAMFGWNRRRVSD